MSESTNSGSRVGIEICAGGLRATVIRRDGTVLFNRTIDVGPDAERVAELTPLIRSLKDELGGIAALGVAVPGLVDQDTGKVAFSAQMPEHSNVDLVKIIQDSSGVTAHVENDANAAAYGEYKLGAGRGSENLFYAPLGEGVGGAFILGGEIWRGSSGFAGEFGYVPINSEGMKLEEVASSANIIRRTRMRFHTDSTSSLNKLGEEAITLENIIKAAGEDDDFAQMMLERTGVYVGTAIASVINLLNPEKIIVGGDIMEAKHTVLDAIISRARELAFEPSYQSTSIVEGELGRYAAAAGAALLAG
jgi:glucokinase